MVSILLYCDQVTVLLIVLWLGVSSGALLHSAHFLLIYGAAIGPISLSACTRCTDWTELSPVRLTRTSREEPASQYVKVKWRNVVIWTNLMNFFSKVKVSGEGQQMQTKILTFNLLLWSYYSWVWRPLSSGLTRWLFVLQSFAENTMNELLGWYGYDKVELRDSDSLEIGETPQHISVLKGMEVWHELQCFGVFYQNNMCCFFKKDNEVSRNIKFLWVINMAHALCWICMCDTSCDFFKGS